MAILPPSTAYVEAWSIVTSFGGDGSRTPTAPLLAALTLIKNALVGNAGRKLDAVTAYDLAPLFAAIQASGVERDLELAVRVRTEAASVAGLLCLSHEYAIRAILGNDASTSLPSALCAGLMEMFSRPIDKSSVKVSLAEFSPLQLALFKALLRALAAAWSAIRDVVGPRTWGTMARAPEKVHRGRRLAHAEVPGRARKQAGLKTSSVSFGKGKARAAHTMDIDESTNGVMADSSLRWSADERQAQASSASAAFAAFFQSPVASELLPAIVDLRFPKAPRAFPVSATTAATVQPSAATIASVVLPALQTISATFYRLSSAATSLRHLAASGLLGALGYWVASAHDACAEAAIRAVDSVALGCGVTALRSTSSASSSAVVPDWPGTEGKDVGTKDVLAAAHSALWGHVTSQERKRGVAWLVTKRMEPVNAKLQAAALSTVVSLTAGKADFELDQQPDFAGVVGRSRFLLPSILSLMEEKDVFVQAEAAYALAHLTANSDRMQTLAHSFGAIPALKKLLAQADAKFEPFSSPKIRATSSMLRESALLALASLTSTLDPPRTATIEQALLPYVVAGLSDQSPRVRAAACQCCRALSRAVSILRTSLLDEGAGPRLFDLVVGVGDDGESDVDEEVRVVAMAAVCNLVLDFSPMKQELLDRGGVAKLVEFSKDQNLQLRLFALFGLKNMTYAASRELKIEVANAMGWEYISQLLDDPELRVQEHAFSLLRNLAFGRVADVDMVVSGLGEARLLSVLETRLQQHCSGALTSFVVTKTPDAGEALLAERLAAADRVALQAVYVVVNVATGSEAHKVLLANATGLLRVVLHLLNDTNPDIRVGAVWSIHNLLHRDSSKRSPAAAALRALGVEGALKRLKDDVILDVRDRARDAVDQLEGKGPADIF